MRTTLVFLLLLVAGNTTGQPVRELSKFYSRGGIMYASSWNEHSKLIHNFSFSLGIGYRIIQGKDFALTVTAPLSAGPAFASKNPLHLSFDAPAMLEMHFGTATGNSDKRGVGVLVGAGVCYHLAIKFSDKYDDDVAISFAGYRAQFGVCWGKNESGSGDKNMLSVIFGKAFNKNSYMAGLGFELVIGNRKKLSDREN